MNKENNNKLLQTELIEILSPDTFKDYKQIILVSKKIFKQIKKDEGFGSDCYLPPQHTRVGVGIILGRNRNPFGPGGVTSTDMMWDSSINKNKGDLYRVNVNNGNVIGTVTYNLDKPNKKLYLDLISINPVQRRKGYGEILMKELVKEHPDYKLIVSPIESKEGRGFFNKISIEYEEPIKYSNGSYISFIEMLEKEIWKPSYEKRWKNKTTDYEIKYEIEGGTIEHHFYNHGRLKDIRVHNDKTNTISSSGFILNTNWITHNGYQHFGDLKKEDVQGKVIYDSRIHQGELN